MLIPTSKTMLDGAISTKFLSQRVSLKSSYPKFEKIFVSPKIAAILNFRINFEEFFISPKMAAILNFRIFARHKNAYISKTVLDRAISTKFLTRRISLRSSFPNFEKNFVSPKMAAILNFRKNCKTQKCLYLENRAR